MTLWTGVGWGLLLTVLFEGFTILLRFGWGRESKKDTRFIARFTAGYRIHHGYIGAVMILFTPLWDGVWQMWWLAVGIGLFLSDMIHHFAVLWPITGSPEFDFRYVLDDSDE